MNETHQRIIFTEYCFVGTLEPSVPSIPYQVLSGRRRNKIET